MSEEEKAPLRPKNSNGYELRSSGSSNSQNACSALVDFLIAETFEDAVFTFIGAISVFGITDREDAIAAMEKDPDARKWAELTAMMIPEPYAQNA